jgi:imidazolonepropionase-like amidohydrolase
MGSKKTLVIRNGTLIDGSGRPPVRNDTIVIAGNRIRSIGAALPDMALEDPRSVEVIDATGQWIMPGLIDAHCHVSYGYPLIKGEGKGKGTTRPEFSTLKSARRFASSQSQAAGARPRRPADAGEICAALFQR